jgi:hypothetical protein
MLFDHHNCQVELSQFGFAEPLPGNFIDFVRDPLVLEPGHRLGPCQSGTLTMVIKTINRRYVARSADDIRTG